MRKDYTQENVLFIVGNSRSGTTMFLRILSNHPKFHSLPEPHFFERYWSPAEKGKPIEKEKAIELFSKLLHAQREGHKKIDINLYQKESKIEIEKIYDSQLTKMEVYSHFLFSETLKNNKSIPCEKTPQNIFYLKEVFDYFPNAKVINLVRDPRSILLSQKQKWKRKKLGARLSSTKEQLRRRINYHPITISRLWNSSVGTSLKYTDNKNFKLIKYEDLVLKPSEVMQEVCKFLNVPFSEKILDIPHRGSSSVADDPNNVGIRTSRIDPWKTGKLNKTEIFICERITKNLMQKFSYKSSHTKANPIIYLLYILALPLKIAVAIILNWERVSNFKEAINRRISTNAK